MRVEKKDPKHQTYTYRPENLTDLYILSQLVEKGDVASALTSRRVRSSGREGREGDKGERVKMVLGVYVDEVMFQDSSVDQRLRIKGRVAFGPEEHVSLQSSHTLNLSVGQPLTLQKPEWNVYHKKLLRDAEVAAKRPPVGVLAIERGEATLGVVNNFNLVQLVHERTRLPGKTATSKARSGAEQAFYNRVLQLLQMHLDRSVSHVIVGGPGLAKKQFLNFVEERWTNHGKVFQVVDLSSGSSEGLREVMQRDILDKVAGDYQVLKEYEFFEEFERLLGQDIQKVSYGLREVRGAVVQGAAETVLLNDNLMRSRVPEQAEEVRTVLQGVEETRAELLVVDSRSDNGRKVRAFGDIVAVLRYPLYTDY